MNATPTIRHRFTHPTETTSSMLARVYGDDGAADVSVGGHVVNVAAIDGEPDAGVEVHDLDARGVCYGTYRFEGRESHTRPLVTATLAVLLGSLAR